jgi:hypothetical protein
MLQTILHNTNRHRLSDEFAWLRVEEVLSRHYFKPDLQAARALYAAVAAHRLTDGRPVWPMLIGPPGSMKTELLTGMECLDKVHFVDQITANTFISGHIVRVSRLIRLVCSIGWGRLRSLFTRTSAPFWQ